MSNTETTQKTHNTLFREGSGLSQVRVSVLADAAAVSHAEVMGWRAGTPLSPAMARWFARFLRTLTTGTYSVEESLLKFAIYSRPPGARLYYAVVHHRGDEYHMAVGATSMVAAAEIAMWRVMRTLKPGVDEEHTEKKTTVPDSLQPDGHKKQVMFFMFKVRVGPALIEEGLVQITDV